MGGIDRRIALWPASGVVVRCGALEMRWIDDDLLVELAELASRGIHDEARMPFTVPWTRGSALEVARSRSTRRAVSRKVGYEPNGVDVVDREGEPVTQQRFVLTRERWQEQRARHRTLLGDDVTLTGFEALREQLNGT